MADDLRDDAERDGGAAATRRRVDGVGKSPSGPDDLVALPSLDDLSINGGARDAVRKVREATRVLARLSFDQGAEREVRRIAGEIAANVFIAWQVAAIEGIAASVLADQRQAMAGTLRDLATGDEAIRALTERIEAGMRRTLEEEILIVLQEKSRKMNQAEQYMLSKSLLPQDGEALKEHYVANTETLLQTRSVRVDTETRARLDALEEIFRKHRERHLEEQTVKSPRMPPG